jgi:AcrR family transcriptional regulator
MAPYRHFADRTALLGAVALHGFIMLNERAASADADPDPAQALIGQGMSYIQFARDKPALFRLMFMDPAGQSLPPSDCTGAYDRLAARIATLAPPELLESATLACWGIVHGLATLALDGRIAPDPAREAAALALLPQAIAGHRSRT